MNLLTTIYKLPLRVPTADVSVMELESIVLIFQCIVGCSFSVCGCCCFFLLFVCWGVLFGLICFGFVYTLLPEKRRKNKIKGGKNNKKKGGKGGEGGGMAFILQVFFSHHHLFFPPSLTQVLTGTHPSYNNFSLQF